MRIEALDTPVTGWGESARWDDVRERLSFVDCATSTLHWVDGGEHHAFELPSMPTGVVLTEGSALVVALDDGLHLVDPDRRTCELLAAYPDALGGRCNDAHADLSGNLITGKLNLEPADGSVWQYSAVHGWTMLRDDISNTNGPAVTTGDGPDLLVVGDTAANYCAFDYDPAAATASHRRVYGDVNGLEGMPDGACFDAEGGLWCALVGGGQVVRFTPAGLDRTIPLPATNPTDVAIGGPDLDTLFVTTISGDGAELDGRVLAIEGAGVLGRPEPRFRLDR